MPVVLSIQSHVVAGAVGNAAAVPILATRHGVEVWSLPTVVLSNHAATPGVTGRRLPGREIARLGEGLAASGALARVDAVLTGYLGTVSVAEAVADIVIAVRRARPDALVVCDPVLGDSGPGLYLPARVGSVYRRRLLALADVATPNLFELGWLTRRPVDTPDQIRAAAETLSAAGPDCVVVTSVPAGPGRIGALTVPANDASLADAPEAPGHVNGLGDVVAAEIMGGLIADPARPLADIAADAVGIAAALAHDAVAAGRDTPNLRKALLPHPGMRAQALD